MSFTELPRALSTLAELKQTDGTRLRAVPSRGRADGREADVSCSYPSKADRRLALRSRSRPYSPARRASYSSVEPGSIESLDWDSHDSNITLVDDEPYDVTITGEIITAADRFGSDEFPDSPRSITGVVDYLRRPCRSETEERFLDDVDPEEVFYTPAATARSTPTSGNPGRFLTLPEISTIPGRLRFEDSSSEDETPQSPNLSVETLRAALPAVNMANAEILGNRRELIEALDSADQDVLPLADLFDDYPVDFIKGTLETADTLGKTLTRCMAFLRVHDGPDYDTNYKDDGVRVKKAVANFIRNGHKHLKRLQDQAEANAEVQGAGARAAATAREQRVSRLAASYLDRGDELANTLTELDDEPMVLDRDIDIVSEKFNSFSSDTDELVKDMQSLVKDAVAAAMFDDVKHLEDKITRLKALKSKCKNTIMAQKEYNGLQGRSAASKSRLSDLTPPVFHGPPSTGGLDFFTFKTIFLEYADSKGLSNEERVSLLKHETLKGPAKSLAAHHTGLDAIWRILQSSFGNATFLISSKTQEIKKLGKCEGDAEKKRDWGIDVLAKLKRLLEIAEQHNKADDLYHSGLTGDICNLLPWETQKEYKKGIILYEDETHTDTSKRDMFHILLSHMQKFVDAETFNVRYKLMNIGSEPVKPREPKAKPPEAHKQGNKLGKRNYNVSEDQNTNPPPSAVYPPPFMHPPPMYYPPPGPYPGYQPVYSVQPGYQPTGANKSGNGVKKGKKPQTQKPKRDDSNEQIAPQPKTPKGIYCKACKEEHQYLFYCKNFQEKNLEDRQNLAGFLRVCHRCLRSDSQVSFVSHMRWKKAHEPVCLTDFPCTNGECKKLNPGRQRHIIMCGRHFSDNERMIKQFTSSIDQRKVIPNLRFHFMSTHSYRTECGPAGADNLAEVDPSEEVNPIYMVQTISSPGGVNLLTFYDSGCTGASISTKAKSALQCETVREGPTILNVAGGKTVKIPHGDERFPLPLIDGTLEPIIALQMDEVTNAFPLWPLMEAYDYISRQYSVNCPEGDELPAVDEQVGGVGVDCMIGIRYNHLFPELRYMLPNGLAIYTAKIQSASGNQGILGGCHKSWGYARDRSLYMGPRAYFAAEMKAYRSINSVLNFRDTLESADLDPFGNVVFPDEIQTNSAYKCASSLFESEYCDNHETSISSEPRPANFHDGPIDPLEDLESTPANMQPTSASSTSAESKNGQRSTELRSRQHSTETEFEFFEECKQMHCGQHSHDFGWLVHPKWDIHSTVNDHARIYSIAKDEQRFWDAENSAADADYRCVVCRNCQKCKDGDRQEKLSLNEEKEDFLIDNTLEYDPKQRVLWAGLPLIEDPSVLAPNKYIAESIFNAQMKLIERRPEVKEDVLKAFNKLRDRNFIVPESEISPEDRAVMEAAFPGEGTFLPWQIVLKIASMSSPARMVFNASSATRSGKSLNSILAKGSNRLTRIFDILIKFRRMPCAVIGDVRMAYNGVRLKPKFYKLQRFLWKDQLNPACALIIMVIVTLIYGVKPSGQQTIAGFCLLAKFTIEHHPAHSPGAISLRDDSYVDDILSAINSLKEAHALAKSIAFVLALGSMEVKKFTFAGEPPSEEVSADGVHVGLVGYLWDPVKDIIRLDIKDLCFGKPKRGKNPEPVQGGVRAALQGCFTRRNLVGQAAKVYDPIGLATPISAKLKLDLHELCDLKLKWDDPAPIRLLDQWVDNMALIMDLKETHFPRAVVPYNSVDGKFDLIASCDASQIMGVASIHAITQLTDGSNHCQLLTAKSKLVKGASIPRAELKAAVLGSVLSHATRRNALDVFKKVIFVTDSAICLFWINQDYRPLQVSVRNSVIQIRRFSLTEQWFHVDSENNVADIGTRSATVEEIGPDSDWQKGRSWMTLPRDQYPLRTTNDINLNSEEKKTALKEMKAPDVGGYVLNHLVSKVGDRYSYSKYVVDPCRIAWPMAVRTVALLYRVAEKAKGQPRPKTYPLVFSDEEMKRAEDYFFKKATREVQHFCKKKDYETITKLEGDILYYTGRVLDTQEYNAMENVMYDLDPLSFVKPITDRYSPVAYSVMVHSHKINHMNAIATLRQSMDCTYTMRGRDLANEVRNACTQCRRFRKNLMKVEKGKVHRNRLTISPAFYNAQLDLVGPYKAYCEHNNHHSSVKVWGAVFKCPSTCAVAAFAMTTYSTPSVIQAYDRFAARYGHPCKLYIDHGSQLMEACRDMEMSMVDLTRTLDTLYRVGVDHSVCPVQAHWVHGQVERSIKDIRKLYKDVWKNVHVDVLVFETALAWISNEINNIPLCLGSKYRDLDHLDLISPNRLILGRINRRSLTGCTLMNAPSRLMKQMEEIYQSWWTTWRNEKMIDFIPQPKYNTKTTYQPKVGDIVLFSRNEPDALIGEAAWRVGRIAKIVVSSDGHVRTAHIEYKNYREATFRTTKRDVRNLPVLHQEGALELVDALNAAAKADTIHFLQHGEWHEEVDI